MQAAPAEGHALRPVIRPMELRQPRPAAEMRDKPLKKEHPADKEKGEGEKEERVDWLLDCHGCSREIMQRAAGISMTHRPPGVVS